jgi:hypothetical protein
MKKQIIFIVFLLLSIGCSKKVYLSDKSQTDTRDSTKIETKAIEDIKKDVVITDSTEVEIIKYSPPDTLGVQYVQERIKINKRLKIAQKEDISKIKVADTTKVFVKSEKRDILLKEKKSVVPYAPLWVLLTIIVILNINKFKKWLQSKL